MGMDDLPWLKPTPGFCQPGSREVVRQLDGGILRRGYQCRRDVAECPDSAFAARGEPGRCP